MKVRSWVRWLFSREGLRLKAWAAVAVVGAAAMLSLLVWSATDGSSVTTPAVPVADQVAAAASDPSAVLSGGEPTAQEAARGILPVEVVSSTGLLASAPSAQAAAVSRDTGVAAVAVGAGPGGAAHVATARLLDEQVPGFLASLDAAGVDVSVVAPSRTSVPTGRALPPGAASQDGGVPGVGFFLLMALPILLAAGLTLMMLRVMRRRTAALMGASPAGTVGAAGRGARADLGDAVPETRFSDVAGCDEAVEELQELVEFLGDPERFSRVGAKVPRGALLVGPPGTGKTLLARAVAGEAGVPFYSAAGSDFVEMYVGVGPKRVRDLFARARKHEGGAIVFIDEVDAVGRKRSSSDRGNQEHENTLNALLVELDGFTRDNVIVLAATNRDDVLDDALTRPGRLDRKIQVPLPDRAGRERILRVHAADRPLADDVDFDLIARRTPGMSGAELAQVVNEACLVAGRAYRDEVTGTDFDHAIASVAMGKARLSAVVTDHDRLVTAWHEAGHTVSAMVLPDADDPVSVSIIPRGPAGGVTWMAQGDDLFLTRRRAFARLVVAMSGRAAEEMLLDGEFTSGPHGDLTSATQTAMAMVTQFGMTDAGLMIRSEGLLSTGAKATDATVEAVEALLADALAAARATLASHRHLLDAVVAGLLEHDTLTHPQLVALQAGEEKVPPVLPPAPREYRRDAAPPAVREPVRAAPAPSRRGARELVAVTLRAPSRLWRRRQRAEA